MINQTESWPKRAKRLYTLSLKVRVVSYALEQSVRLQRNDLKYQEQQSMDGKWVF